VLGGCPADCSGNGKCTLGVCECASDWTGPACNGMKNSLGGLRIGGKSTLES
jgi:hypothetical protein